MAPANPEPHHRSDAAPWIALRAALRGAWQVVHLSAVVLVLALSPSSYRGGFWPELARQIHRATLPVLLWFTALSSLLGLVLIRIVAVTAQGYGLSQYAVDMVVRVLVLELIPLGAALFAAMRVGIPLGDELVALRAAGHWQRSAQAGRDPLRWLVLPRALAVMFAVLKLVALSGVIALLMAYLALYGFTPWAIDAYTRSVGQVFSPVVTMVFAFKTAFFSLAVALVPLAAAATGPLSLEDRPRSELQMLVRLFLVLLVVESVSLLGSYL